MSDVKDIEMKVVQADIELSDEKVPVVSHTHRGSAGSLQRLDVRFLA